MTPGCDGKRSLEERKGFGIGEARFQVSGRAEAWPEWRMGAVGQEWREMKVLRGSPSSCRLLGREACRTGELRVSGVKSAFSS